MDVRTRDNKASTVCRLGEGARKAVKGWGLELLCKDPRWRSDSLTVIETPKVSFFCLFTPAGRLSAVLGAAVIHHSCLICSCTAVAKELLAYECDFHHRKIDL